MFKVQKIQLGVQEYLSLLLINLPISSYQRSHRKPVTMLAISECQSWMYSMFQIILCENFVRFGYIWGSSVDPESTFLCCWLDVFAAIWALVSTTSVLEFGKQRIQSQELLTQEEVYLACANKKYTLREDTNRLLRKLPWPFREKVTDRRELAGLCRFRKQVIKAKEGLLELRRKRAEIHVWWRKMQERERENTLGPLS